MASAGAPRWRRVGEGSLRAANVGPRSSPRLCAAIAPTDHDPSIRTLSSRSRAVTKRWSGYDLLRKICDEG